ncbi:Phosphatidic acid phostphatase, putative [Trypanosoma equiperdum]|uniref:Phosphatidic acid phostphatase, putative n=1 Tax=Trypanosoma equiperdum TaxID=5694 RepID=A0A1G4IDJ6_TRYEQ|nr:Phosphatidic acid phostphatase, putative [Trypanosoma equiperdum]
MTTESGTCCSKFVHYCKVFHVLDYFLLIGIAFVVCLWMESLQPYCRGFSWTDATISYKLKSSTFSVLTLLIMEVAPIGFYFIMEFLRALFASKGEWYLDIHVSNRLPDESRAPVEMLEVSSDGFNNAAAERTGNCPDGSFTTENKGSSKRLMTFLETANYWVVAHGFSVVLALCIVEVLKVYAGVLRPDFLARLEREGYNSTSRVKDWCKVAAEGRRSFPSGHSGCAFSVFTPMAMYFLSVLRAFSGASVWRTLVGLLPIYFACAVAASRLRDNRHHSGDVVAGSVIGMLSGLLAVAIFFRLGKGKAFLVPRRLDFVRRHGGQVLSDITK